MSASNFGKLGKLSAKHDPRTLQVSRYMKAMAPAPQSADWTPTEGKLGLMCNDKLGCCTISAAGHLIQVWTGAAKGSPVVLPDSDIISAYSGATGYNPAVPATDRGGVEIDVLNYWRNNGVGSGTPHKIVAFAAIDPLDHQEVMQSISLFGGVYCGANLPRSAQSQFGCLFGALWDVAPPPAGTPGTWGGHAIPVVKYDGTGLWCITWGAVQKMTWAFWDRYVDEAYAIVTQDWIEANGQSPSGFDLPALQADLQEVTQ